MTRLFLFVLFLFTPNANVGISQEVEVTPLPDVTFETPQFGDLQAETSSQPAEAGVGAVLRALDKVSGEVLDIELLDGQDAQVFGLRVAIMECRYPAENKSGDAFAYLLIGDGNNREPAFSGWMAASSPALNALDHPRFDVWVLRCITS